jgi:aminoglycoside phosphotransferase (APT) family kinase protein
MAGPMWAAEIVVAPEFAAGLISEQFPALSAAPVTELETGWDNTAFVVDAQWLFRFPRREVAVPGVRREIEVLPRLAPRLPLPIPDPVFVGQPSERYPWPFFGARLLPGGELAESGLTESGRAQAAAEVGSFLRELHDPGLVPLVQGAGLPADPMRRASPPVRAQKARDVLIRLVDRGLWPAGDAVSALLDRAEAEPDEAVPGDQAGEADAPGDGPLVVSHGDFHVRHLLVDGGAATGVIDWGDLCIADPAVDLSIAYLGFAGPARADLLAAYGRPVTARRELAARTCAISIGVSLAEYAADEDRSVLLAESLAGLHRAVS